MQLGVRRGAGRTAGSRPPGRAGACGSRSAASKIRGPRSAREARLQLAPGHVGGVVPAHQRPFTRLPSFVGGLGPPHRPRRGRAARPGRRRRRPGTARPGDRRPPPLLLDHPRSGPGRDRLPVVPEAGRNRPGSPVSDPRPSSATGRPRASATSAAHGLRSTRAGAGGGRLPGHGGPLGRRPVGRCPHGTQACRSAGRARPAAPGRRPRRGRASPAPARCPRSTRSSVPPQSTSACTASGTTVSGDEPDLLDRRPHLAGPGGRPVQGALQLPVQPVDQVGGGEEPGCIQVRTDAGRPRSSPSVRASIRTSVQTRPCRGDARHELLGSATRAEDDRLGGVQRRLEVDVPLELGRRGAGREVDRSVTADHPVHPGDVAAEPVAHVGRSKPGQVAQGAQAEPAQQAHRVGLVEDVDGQRAQELRRPARGHHQALLGPRAPGGLLGGEQLVGHPGAAVPDPEARPAARRAPPPPPPRRRRSGRASAARPARTQRRDAGPDLLDRHQHVLERARPGRATPGVRRAPGTGTGRRAGASRVVRRGRGRARCRPGPGWRGRPPPGSRPAARPRWPRPPPASRGTTRPAPGRASAGLPHVGRRHRRGRLRRGTSYAGGGVGQPEPGAPRGGRAAAYRDRDPARLEVAVPRPSPVQAGSSAPIRASQRGHSPWTSSTAERLRSRAPSRSATDGATRPPGRSSTTGVTSTRAAVTSSHCSPGSGTSTVRASSTPVSAAASAPKSGIPTTAHQSPARDGPASSAIASPRPSTS